MWIARDKDGSLWLYGAKPIKFVNMFVEDGENETLGTINNSQFPEVTWENSPKELIIKPEEE